VERSLVGVDADREGPVLAEQELGPGVPLADVPADGVGHVLGEGQGQGLVVLAGPEPVAGSSSMPTRGSKKRETKSTLSFAPDGSVLLRLKTPWRDGTSHIALQPVELLEKLAALIPRPYVNLIVYHGVLAPNAKWRREVVDFGRPQVERA